MTTTVSREQTVADYELDSWYVYGVWNITGETWGYKGGVVTTGLPNDPASGMWQLGLRYDTADLNDGMSCPQVRRRRRLRASPACWVARKATGRVGVNWYWRSNFKFSLNYVKVDSSRYIGRTSATYSLDPANNNRTFNRVVDDNPRHHRVPRPGSTGKRFLNRAAFGLPGFVTPVTRLSHFSPTMAPSPGPSGRPYPRSYTVLPNSSPRSACSRSASPPWPPSAPRPQNVTGAGASFVYPVMSKWSADYNKATGNEGQLPVHRLGRRHRPDQGGTVDFGSSDAPLKPEELQRSPVSASSRR